MVWSVGIHRYRVHAMQFRDYSDYEQEARKIRSENELLLNGFKVWLIESGLKENTIKKHMGNAWFYITEYLLYEDAVCPQDGLSAISEFFNWFFRAKLCGRMSRPPRKLSPA